MSGPDHTAELLFGSGAPDPAALTGQLVLHRMPGYLIRRLDSRAASLYELHTQQSTLTTRQFGLLQVVHAAGTIRQSELADALHLDRSTLGEMLQRVVDRGLVERHASTADRRTSEIRLTERGTDTLLANVQGALEAQRAFLAPLPDYLRPVFMRCLELLADADPSAEMTGDAGEPTRDPS